MSDEIVIHCPTEKEFQEVKKKAGGYGGIWHHMNTGYRLRDGDSSSITYQENIGYTIISAADYLNERKEGEFQVGDRVECVRKGGTFIEVGQVYTVAGHTNSNRGYVLLEEALKQLPSSNYRTSDFKLSTKQNKPIKEETTMKKGNDINEAVKTVFGGKEFTGDQMMLVDKHYGGEIKNDVLSQIALEKNKKEVLKLAEAKEDAEIKAE